MKCLAQSNSRLIFEKLINAVNLSDKIRDRVN